MSFLKRKEKIYHFNDPIDPHLFGWHPWVGGEPRPAKKKNRLGGMKTAGDKKGNGNDALFGSYPYKSNGPDTKAKKKGPNKPWVGGTGKFNLSGHYAWMPEGPSKKDKKRKSNKNGPGIRLGTGTKRNTFGNYPYMANPNIEKKEKKRGGDWKPNSWQPKEFNRFQGLPAKLREKKKPAEKKRLHKGWRTSGKVGKQFAPQYKHMAEPYQNKGKEAKFSEKPWYPTEVHKHGPADNWINTEYVDEDHLARDIIMTNKKEKMVPDALVKQRANHRAPGTPETFQTMHVGYQRKVKPSDNERMNELRHYRTTREEAAQHFDPTFSFTSKKQKNRTLKASMK